MIRGVERLSYIRISGDVGQGGRHAGLPARDADEDAVPERLHAEGQVVVGVVVAVSDGLGARRLVRELVVYLVKIDGYCFQYVSSLELI